MTGWLVAVAVAYVIGSIPFGVIIGSAKGVDIREHGSRNIGATNVGRVLGRRLGILCFVLDLLKGAAPVAGAGAIHGTLGRSITSLSPSESWWWLGVAAAAIVGHLASIFLRFGGGKGVATSFGALAAMAWVLTIPALAALVTWIVVVRITRYISVASIAAALTLPVSFAAAVVISADGPIADALAHAAAPLVVTTALAGLVLWRHRGNIARLRKGLEPRLGTAAVRNPDGSG